MSTRLENSKTTKPSAGREPVGKHANRTIYVRAIVDAARLLSDRALPLDDAETETPAGLESRQLFITTTAGTADQSTGAIALKACAGDIIRFIAKSGSNNFEHAVVIADVRLIGDDEMILEGFSPATKSQAEISLASNTEQAPEAAEQTFWFWQCAVVRTGTLGFSLILALYDRDEDGRPRFAGLYRWDLQLTIHCRPASPKTTAQKQERTP